MSHSREEVKDQYKLDFLEEVRKTCRQSALENYFGGLRRIIQEHQVKDRPHYCGVLGVRMAEIWGVTRGTANRRLQALEKHGVQRATRWGYSHCDRYHAPEDLVLRYIAEAIEHWTAVGYSQDELRSVIREGDE